MRLIASSAIGEIADAFLPRRALAATSANSKNCRRAWAQHNAAVIGPARACRVVQLVVAAVRVGLQDAGEAVKVPRGMLMPAIARGVIKRCRRRAPAKWPVVTHIGPDAALNRLALGQDRHRRVITMQPLGGAAHGTRSAHKAAAAALVQAPTWSANVDKLRSMPSRR